MKYKTFINKYLPALTNFFNFWIPKPTEETLEEYVLNEYKEEISWLPKSKQEKLLKEIN